MSERAVPDCLASGRISRVLAELEVQTFTYGSSRTNTFADFVTFVTKSANVPERGLEPPWIAPHAPKTCASTISPPGLLNLL